MSEETIEKRGKGRPKLNLEAVCAKCGGNFPVSSRCHLYTRKYCSRSCANRDRNRPHHKRDTPYEFRRYTPPERPRSPWVESICPVCNRTYWVMPSLAKDLRTCSRECFTVWRHTSTIKIVCKRCGSEREVYNDKRKRHEFCSARCAAKYRSGDRHPRWVKGRISNCLQCSKEFPRFIPSKSGRMTYSERKFCSSQCRKAYHLEHPHKKCFRKGATRQYGDGYIYEKVGEKVWIPQHRLVMERELGRKLKRGEDVHHKNGVKTDNRPENLQVVTKSQHQQIHAAAERLAQRLMCFTGDWIHPLEGMAV